MSDQKSVIIPPSWRKFLCGLVPVALCGVDLYEQIWKEGIETPTLHPILWVGVLMLAWACVHGSFHKKGFVIRFLWIPIWLIPWHKITDVQYVTKWNTGAYQWDIDRDKHYVHGHMFIVTWGNCPFFEPETDDYFRFPILHPFQSMYLRFSGKNTNRYVKTVQQYYPFLDIHTDSE